MQKDIQVRSAALMHIIIIIYKDKRKSEKRFVFPTHNLRHLGEHLKPQVNDILIASRSLNSHDII